MYRLNAISNIPMRIYLRNTRRKSTGRMGPKVRRNEMEFPQSRPVVPWWQSQRDSWKLWKTVAQSGWSVTVPRSGPVVPWWQAQRDSLKLRSAPKWTGGTAVASAAGLSETLKDSMVWPQSGPAIPLRSGTLRNSKRQWRSLAGNLRNSERQWHGPIWSGAPKRTGGTTTF